MNSECVIALIFSLQIVLNYVDKKAKGFCFWEFLGDAGSGRGSSVGSGMGTRVWEQCPWPKLQLRGALLTAQYSCLLHSWTLLS